MTPKYLQHIIWTKIIQWSYFCSLCKRGALVPNFLSSLRHDERLRNTPKFMKYFFHVCTTGFSVMRWKIAALLNKMKVPKSWLANPGHIRYLPLQLILQLTPMIIALQSVRKSYCQVRDLGQGLGPGPQPAGRVPWLGACAQHPVLLVRRLPPGLASLLRDPTLGRRHWHGHYQDWGDEGHQHHTGMGKVPNKPNFLNSTTAPSNGQIAEFVTACHTKFVQILTLI